MGRAARLLEHTALDCHLPAGYLCRVAAQESNHRRPAQGVASCFTWNRSGGARLAVELAISGHQTGLDILIRAGGGRLQRDSPWPVLSGGGCMWGADLVPALRLDGDELYHGLSGS